VSSMRRRMSPSCGMRLTSSLTRLVCPRSSRCAS